MYVILMLGHPAVMTLAWRTDQMPRRAISDMLKEFTTDMPRPVHTRQGLMTLFRTSVMLDQASVTFCQARYQSFQYGMSSRLSIGKSHVAKAPL